MRDLLVIMGRKLSKLTRKGPNEWIKVACAVVATGGSVTEAARAAGVTRQAIYQRIDKDPAFRAAFTDAIEQGTDLLEHEATRRAVHGVEEPVIYQGQPTPLYELDANGTIKTKTVEEYNDQTGETKTRIVPIPLRDEHGNPKVLTIRKPSDTLMIFLLKGRRPAKFRENVDITSGGKPLPVKVLRGITMDEI